MHASAVDARGRALGPGILEDLEIPGVNEWGDSAIVIRCRFKVKPMQQWIVRRAFWRG